MRRDYVSILLLALLLTIFFHDICFFGKTLSTASLIPGTTLNGPYGFSGHRPDLPFSFDTGGNAWVNEPNPTIIRQVLNEGALPTWNPREGLGIPLIGNLNAEVLNPLRFFLNLFPDPFLQDLFFLLRLLVMGSFTHLFLREMKLSQASSLLGSSFFMLSGYSVWWVNLHSLSTVMYIPAVFYFYERWSERKDMRSAFFMSFFIFCAFTAGKIPDVIMGLCLLFLYALWKGLRKDSLNGLYREGGKIMIGTVSGALMASVVLLPFLELYSLASPLAKAIRTGAASHTIPLITSVSLFQPLFLGLKNYFYESWIQWEPHIILPHASAVIMLLSLYAVINRKIVMNILPYFVFSLFLFFMVYGILPSHVISRLPVLGSIEFLKYNAMFYFSLSVMAAFAFDDLLSTEGDKKKFNLSMAIVCLIIIAYFSFLYGRTPQGMKGYMMTVLLLSLSGFIIIGLFFHLSRKRQVFGISVFIFLILELFLYMPKDHPDRIDPYREPPYLRVISEKDPYRIIGGGNCVPPLVSNAVGLYDIRATSVLLPRDYYILFENLLSFSVPQTNDPAPLFSATSPFIDLMGVKYILSQQPLDYRRLDDEIRSHISSLRWIRFFDAMITHTIKGGATYGFFDRNGDRRFSFFFPMKFAFETNLKVTEPFIFTGLTLRDVQEGTTAKVRIKTGDDITELMVRSGEAWDDHWLDVSRHMGKMLRYAIEADGVGDGRIVLGNVGLSPGQKEEDILYGKLLTLHKKEVSGLDYRGTYEGINVYENRNVMGRAFILHKVKKLGGLNDIIQELQGGTNFRDIGLVTDFTPEITGRLREFSSETEGEKSPVTDEKIMIKKYTADEILLAVESAGGLLVLSDFYYPGWKVRVNGKEEDIIKVFGVLRGVPVKSGKSEVLFTYRPMSFYAGAGISSATVVLWMVYLYFRRRKKYFPNG